MNEIKICSISEVMSDKRHSHLLAGSKNFIYLVFCVAYCLFDIILYISTCTSSNLGIVSASPFIRVLKWIKETTSTSMLVVSGRIMVSIKGGSINIIAVVSIHSISDDLSLLLLLFAIRQLWFIAINKCAIISTSRHIANL